MSAREAPPRSPASRAPAAAAPLGLRIARSGLLVLLVAAGVWHVLPLVVWEASVGPELARQPNAARLDVPFEDAFPPAPPSFDELVYRGVALRAPLRDPQAPPCVDLPGTCYRLLVGGSMSVHGEPPQESLEEMIELRAPAARDLSWRRSALANWATIGALRARVLTIRARLDSWRYRTPFSRGVVARHTRPGGPPSWIVAAYDPGGEGARVIGLSGLSPRTVREVIGTIRFPGPSPRLEVSAPGAAPRSQAGVGGAPASR